MNRKRFLAIFFAVLIAFSSIWMITASATEDDTVPASEYSEDTEPESEDTEPESEDTEPETYDTEPETEDTEPQYDDTEPQYEDTEPQYEEPEETYDWSDDSSEDDYSDDNGNYEEREANTSDQKAATAAVYDAEKDDVSKDTLNKSDWEKIAAQLKNASQSGDDDFAFIRNNDANGANNGEWMLILGIAMEVIGIGVIVFVIIYGQKRKKAANGPSHSGNPYVAGGPKPKKKPELTRADKQSAKKRSKFDTAEIELPKQENPKRYKPKH